MTAKRTARRAGASADTSAPTSHPSLLVPYYEPPPTAPPNGRRSSRPRPASTVSSSTRPTARVPPDPAFIQVAGRLRAAGVRLRGYTDTGYGRRPVRDVVRELTRYHAWYGTHGMFLDQAAAELGEFDYYRRLAAAVWGAGVPSGVRGAAGHRRRRPRRTRGASVHCAVPGVGDHPWGVELLPLEWVQERFGERE
ncbi:spherulation-specific family 4 protein [Streptomyces sp. NBC_00391]|uniref:spherulation-specific family 4 protein n=1 Tax=Streptomyces sp. NBC_00391 TaxID=2903647 RepID=UPI002E229412